MKPRKTRILILLFFFLAFTFLGSSFFHIAPVHATTTYLSDNFESFPAGWTTAASGGTVNKSSTQHHGGSYSSLYYVPTVADYGYALRAFTAPTGDYHVQVYMYMDSAVTPDACGLSVSLSNTVSGATSFAFTIAYHDSAFYLRNLINSNGIVWEDICSISANAWHCIDAYFINSTGKMHYYLDNVKQGSNWTPLGTAFPNRIILGDGYGTSYYSGELYVDDLVIDNTAELIPNTVTLNSPAAGSTVTTASVNFNYTPSFPQGTIVNSSLWLLTNTWQSVQGNTTAVQNGTSNLISYTFSSEGTYVWNIQVFNSTNSIFGASNHTVTVDIPPRWQNAGSNVTTITPGNSALLYSQGYDGINLDWAWLSTNESGTWNNLISGSSAWVTPTGNEGAADWINPSNTYDGSTATYANSPYVLYGYWSSYLTLDTPTTTGGGLRYWISYGVNNVGWLYNVDVYLPANSSWVSIVGSDNVGPSGQWDNVSFPTICTYSKVRFRYGNWDPNYQNNSIPVYEVNVLSNPPVNGSPIVDIHVSGTWTWTNFTWTNSSVGAGTCVQWRIYYNDTYGNVNCTSIQTFYIGSTISITITSSTVGSGFVTVDGNTITTPQTYLWNPGDNHIIAANSPANLVSGQSQYVWQSWNDSGAQSHSITVPSSNTTYTASFQLQYYLTVQGGNSPSGQGWYDSGATATVTNTWVWSTVANQSRTALTNYYYDNTAQNPARSNTANYTTPILTMDTHHNVTFISTTQYYNTLTSTISGPAVTQSGSQTGDSWYDSGTLASVSCVTPYLNGTVNRFVFLNWSWSRGGVSQSNSTNNPFSITMSNYVSISANWAEDKIVLYSYSIVFARVNVGSTVWINLTYEWQSDNVLVGSGFTVKINGSSLTIDSGWTNFTVYTASVERVTYQLTEAEGGNYYVNAVVPAEIWDSITVQVVVADHRIDVDTNATIFVTGTYDYDSSAFDGSFTLNYTSFNRPSPQRRGYTVTAISGGAWGITVISSSNSDYVLWDSVSISIIVTHNRIDVNTNASISVTGTYDYDGSSYDGVITLNDTTFIHPSVGRHGYTVASISGDSYNITTISANDQDYVIWDTQTITISADANTAMVGSQINFTVTARYAYDNGIISSATINILRNGTHLATGSFFDVQFGDVSYQYTTENASETTYGLTTFTTNTVTATWSNLFVEIYQVTTVNGHINIGTSSTIYWHCRFNGNGSDCTTGTLYVNGTGYTINGTGWATSTNTSLTVLLKEFSVSGVDVNNLQYFNQIPADPQVIWDGLTINIIVLSSRININVNASITVTATRAYDGTPSDGLITLNYTTYNQTSVGRWAYTVASVSGDSQGITAIATNDVKAIIWDRAEIVSGGFSPTYLHISDNTTLYYVLQYEYDGTNITDGTVEANGYNMAFNISSARWELTVTKYGLGTYTYQVSDVSGNLYGITVINDVAGPENCTFYANLNIRTVDVNSNVLLLTTVYMNNGSLPLGSGNSSSSWGGVQVGTNFHVLATVGGWANFTDITCSNATVQVYVTWHGLTVKVTYTLGMTVLSDTTVDVTCLCYPFTLSSVTYHVASNATIASATWASYVLTVQFSSSGGNYLLCDDGPVPTYLLNVTYDLATDYGTYLHLTHSGQTLSIGYQNWGGTFVQKVDRVMTDLTIAGQKLSMTFSGTPPQMGEVDVCCGSRGNPPETGGFTTSSYVNSVFIGYYLFNGTARTVYLQWSVSGGIFGGNPNYPAPNLVLDIAFSFPQTVQPGQIIYGMLNVTWAGENTVSLEDLKAAASNWTIQVKSGTFPVILNLNVTLGRGFAQVPVTLMMPANITAGTYNVPILTTFSANPQITRGFRTSVSLTVVVPSAPIPSLLIILFLISIFSVLLGSALFTRSRKQHF